MRVAVFGLGEAGGLISAGLASSGVDVRGFDPAAVPDPAGVQRLADPASVVAGAEFVLAITAAADAVTALEQAIDSIPRGAVYADLATAAPSLKRQLASTAHGHGLCFADVALMAPVPGKGIHTPVGVSGSGARRFAESFTGLGMPVENVGETAGEAGLRKLLRSVMMKGLAALLIEAMQAGHAAGVGDWLWKNMVRQLTVADDVLLARLVTGTRPHALRRLHEMEAAEQLLTELGVDPLMTRSTVESLRRAPGQELPDLPGTSITP